MAAEPVLPWSAGAFLRAYVGNRGTANALALESSIVSAPIMFLLAKVPIWQGTAGALLAELETHHTDDRTRKRKDWPDKPRTLSGELRRLAPNLRKAEIVVTFGRRTRNGTLITLELVGKTPSPSSPSSPPQETLENAGVVGDDSVTVGDGGDEPLANPHLLRHPENPDNHGENGRSDDGDGRDGDLRPGSDGDGIWGEV